MKLLEKDIEKAITDFLTLDGWICRKMEQNYNERKRKCVGEAGMPDQLCIRYEKKADWGSLRNPTSSEILSYASVMWLELKAAKGKASKVQAEWNAKERERLALALIAGRDFPATIEGFKDWYLSSGLNRKLR